MSDREDVVTEARHWIGTPYVHQASCLGGGSDCLGLIRGVWRALFGSEPEAIPFYTADWAEPQRSETLLYAAERWFLKKPMNSTDAGDLLVFRMVGSGIAKHLGISSKRQDIPTFIHAYSGHCVIETSLSTPWERRIAGRFEFPRGVK
jgi:NlpC/P60 family putative phage cell wall peptidase